MADTSSFWKEFFLDSILGYAKLLVRMDLVAFIKAIICSFINVLILGVILALFLGMSQGHVIPLDLFTRESLLNPLNIILFHLMLVFLSSIMTLYPTYIYAVLFNPNEHFWKMKRWGIIYYYKDKANQNGDCITKKAFQKTDSSGSNGQRDKLRPYEAMVRKFSGVSLFLIWSWVLTRITSFHHYDSADQILVYSINTLSTILTLCAFHYYQIGFKKHTDNNQRILKVVNMSKGLLAFTFLFLIALVVINAIVDWSIWTIILEQFICLFLAVFMIIFRSFRCYYKSKYVTNIIYYLSTHRVVGFSILFILILCNAFVEISLFLNVLNIVLLYLIAAYTAIILPIKLYLFLNNKKDEVAQDKNKLNLLGIPFKIKHYNLTIIGLLIYLVFIVFRGNQLHRLEVTEYSEDLPTFGEFYTSTRDHLNGRRPAFYSAYGGGLKANVWNLHILLALDEMKASEHIISLSGVSGGSMGIGLHSLMHYRQLDEEQYTQEEFVEKLSTKNILGIELPWLLGFDLIRECLPDALVFGYDRSHRTMKYYSRLMGDEKLAKESFQTIVSRLRQKYGYWPHLAFNSTAKVDRYGIVTSLSGHGLFPAAIDLLDTKDSTGLYYLDAVSTSNRFPIVSPAAEVDGKGIFVDGGYFENSGMMSNISLRKALQKFESDSLDRVFDEKSLFISIRNSKENYLEHIIQRAYPEINIYEYANLHGSTELGAIINTFLNLERMPSYLRSMLNQYYSDDYKVIFIDLPYYIDKDEVDDMLGGVSIHKEVILRAVRESNDRIVELLVDEPEYRIDRYGIVSPPTARILSKPAAIYMKTMMKHPYVLDQLKQIGDELSITSINQGMVN